LLNFFSIKNNHSQENASA